LLPSLSFAAELDGSRLKPIWALPLVGILLSIALMPLMVPGFWHHHFGKVSAAWTLAFFLPFAFFFGVGAAGASLVHAMLAEYIPFVVSLTVVYTLTGAFTSAATCMAVRHLTPVCCSSVW
jgi:Na+/H+ antiporter NhaD/arsenite permease-like protein